ncbi:PREDICTED: protein SLOW GREEN 1, chloroplastic-like [Ipomoea nil]|uniref:protein SLOW GREEN 1, chloroplastic-like n=1 Tax=Ipomoea nil TaxID=35883 RepID=UPI000901B295|nr:PREDICTED: protein SLOW GREEN 1, chloroplastic-like [Ipomoea nil]
MNTINNVSAKPNLKLFSSLSHHHPILSRPVSSLSFRTPPSSQPSITIRASSSSSSPEAPKPNLFNALNPQNPSPALRQSLTPPSFQLPLSLLKCTVVTTVTAAALFFGRFCVMQKPAVASPVSAPAAMETAFSDEDKERVLEENLLLNPNDVGALRSLMEMKIQSRKIAEAIGIIDRLMEIDPSDTEWPLLKSHLYAYSGEVETAKNGFNEILAKDPFRVEAYHGLVMAASESKSTEDLKEIEKRIEESMNLCKKQGKKAEFRDFKLLEAQIRVIEGKHDEALKVYQELVKEEPRDFRPYICQGIIYTLLRENNEAEKNFEKFRRLVPKGHPYATYFDESMIATKVFAQKMENEIAMSKK